MSDSKLYSLEQLNMIQEGDTGFTKTIITAFLQSVPQNASELAEACNLRDWDKVYFLAHKMKPSIVLMEIRGITREIIIVEQNARSKTDLENIPALVMHIQEVINQAAIQLQEDFGL